MEPEILYIPPDPVMAARHRLVTYGVTAEMWEAILSAQDGVCYICHDGASSLGVDHDHRTGRIRGALCGRCNRGIGVFLDDADACERAAAYLRRSTDFGHVSSGAEPIFS